MSKFNVGDKVRTVYYDYVGEQWTISSGSCDPAYGTICDTDDNLFDQETGEIDLPGSQAPCAPLRLVHDRSDELRAAIERIYL